MDTPVSAILRDALQSMLPHGEARVESRGCNTRWNQAVKHWGIKRPVGSGREAFPLELLIVHAIRRGLSQAFREFRRQLGFGARLHSRDSGPTLSRQSIARRRR